VWQGKDLQEAILNVWQAKELRANLSPLDFARGEEFAEKKGASTLERPGVGMLGAEYPTPRGFCMDVQRKELREEGFVSL
jgi:hypothetical protein